ncbi:hypothetical protein [uncultured Winogradskyella sp.]|uniref:hypothetical protein n=1 Tax=uncultured Winogradskyella sp. TaxID=395353 RepID=UPI002614E48E|nr:hypothetical protein [uncultured Winogradskyella sp.]
MKNYILIFILLVSIGAYAQKSNLSIFDNLVEKTWKANGNWGDGSKFYQEINFEYSLDNSIVIAKSIGYIDKEQTKLGLRNHGIRMYDKVTKSLKFWEFDVFGGLTKGTVFSKGKNIIYQYTYGTSTVTDMWEYVNDSTYNFKVGNYVNGEWEQLYLSTQFKEVK